MASYNELNALIDAYINRNGVQAITGQILNGVLKAMVEQLGRGYTIMGAAIPTTDPGTPDGPECYFASAPGTYTDFDGLQIVPGELALLCYTPTDGWTKETIYEGFQTVQATIDGNVGTPSVGVSYADGILSFDFHNMKGNTGDPAGFGTIGADITGGVGTPGVTVESSGPATAKNLQFHFTNLKGETGVTSVVATVDNTTGTPTCTVSLVGQQLTLAFTGLKGAQGDTGSSVDYPFTIVNNLTTDDATQALSAAQGVVLQGEVSQLEAELTGLDINYTPSLYLNNNDTKSKSVTEGITHFIPCQKDDVVIFHNGYSEALTGRYAIIYDNTKTMIASQYYGMATSGNFPERTLTLPNASSTYLRMSFAIGSGAFVSINGTKVWEESTPEIGIEEYLLRKTGAEHLIFPVNGYLDWEAGYVDKTDGHEENSSVNSRTSYIDISGYSRIRILMSITTAVSDAGVCFYDSSLQFVGSVSSRVYGDQRDNEERILDVPSSAKYVRASIYTQFANLWYLYGQIAPDFMEKGEIQNYIGIRQKVTMEFGNLDVAGQIKPYSTDFFSFARTSLYYKLRSVNLPYSYKIYEYGSDYSFVGVITASANTVYQLDESRWYKITINYTENSLPVKEIVIELDVIGKSYNIITPKTIKTFQYLVKYKKGRGLYVDGDSDYSEVYDMEDDLISNTLRLYLPSNYSPTGEPVKMIYKAHGTNGYSWIDLDTWGGDSSIDYLADEGFALYDMFAGTSYYSAIINPTLTHSSTTRIANYNVPIQLAAQVSAYEWVVRNFNIDPRIYVFGKSHGGLAGIYATNKIVPTRAVALFAPLITQVGDMYKPWGLNFNECSMCLDDMCFVVPEGMTFAQMADKVWYRATGWKTILLDNIRQQAGLIPYLNGITNVKQSTLLSALMDDTYKVQGAMDDIIRHTETPVKVWCAPDDDEVLFANGWNFVKSLQNGGSNAQFREFPSNSGGHYFDSFTDANSIKDTVTTALGVQYTAPRAYIEAVNFFHQF